MTSKREWKWGENECRIEGRTLYITMGGDKNSGYGFECELSDFLRGELTWHLPKHIRRQALAAAQEILKVRGPLPAAVLRGDINELVPEVGAARDRQLAEQRARDAEWARLCTPVGEADLPDPRCSICRGLMEKFEQNRKEFERLIGSVFPHDRHAAALRAVDRRVEELRAGMKDPAACALCGPVASPTNATRVKPLPPEAQRIVAWPEFFHVPSWTHATRLTSCPECGCIWSVWDHIEDDDDTDETHTYSIYRSNVESLRACLEDVLHRGTVPDWLAAVIQQA